MFGDELVTVQTNVQAKHKFALRDFNEGEILVLYGVPVGRALRPISRGESITTENVMHGPQYGSESD